MVIIITIRFLKELFRPQNAKEAVYYLRFWVICARLQLLLAWLQSSLHGHVQSWGMYDIQALLPALVLSFNHQLDQGYARSGAYRHTLSSRLPTSQLSPFPQACLELLRLITSLRPQGRFRYSSPRHRPFRDHRPESSTNSWSSRTGTPHRSYLMRSYTLSMPGGQARSRWRTSRSPSRPVSAGSSVVVYQRRYVQPHLCTPLPDPSLPGYASHPILCHALAPY